ncbi:MAG: NADPH-dependent oxidoreductase [Chitinophagaceae bacterium]|nr:MAG: NADPH-dependent oxidoreductase [Chitinophagaceae bacterium]
MITIISGSSRHDNNTRRVANEYQRILAEQFDQQAYIYSLDSINGTVRDAAFKEAEQEMLVPAAKFIIIMPEYNGSYPGILKLMIDNSDIKTVWWHKKVLLVGVSTGRAGNLRGMEHLTGVLLHMKMLVHPNRLPISVVDKLMDANHRFADEATLAAIHTQLAEFIHF